MKYLYVLICNDRKIHYGGFYDETKAREKAREYENKDGLKRGSIDIYEIPENWIK